MRTGQREQRVEDSFLGGSGSLGNGPSVLGGGHATKIWIPAPTPNTIPGLKISARHPPPGDDLPAKEA